MEALGLTLFLGCGLRIGACYVLVSRDRGMGTVYLFRDALVRARRLRLVGLDIHLIEWRDPNP